MRRILIDGIYLGMQMKGVGRYAANVLRQFSVLDSMYDYWILVRAGMRLPTLPQGPHFHYVPISLHNHFVHGWWTLPIQAMMRQADLAWIPYESTIGKMPCPYSIVCHDVPHLIGQAQKKAGSEFTPFGRIITSIDSALIQKSLFQAAMVFCNSVFVGSWLRDGLNIPSDHISYAPCAPGADFARLAEKVDRIAAQRRLNCPNGYILVFATGDPRENLDTVFRVFKEELIPKGVKVNLVIAGVRENNKAQLYSKLNKVEWKQKVRVLPFYGEDHIKNLAEIYTAADVYLDLSLHEGFGMQVVEAMACGTPVVCGNGGALPEVASDAALIVDPMEIGTIGNAVVSILTNQELRNSLVFRGRARAGQYNWNTTTRTILSTFNAL